MTYDTVDLSDRYAEDLTFDESLAQHLDTSIRIDADGLSFLGIHHSDPTQSVYSRLTFDQGDVTLALKTVFFDHPVLSLPYRHLQLSVDDGSRYILLPHAIGHIATPKEWLSSTLNTDGKEVMKIEVKDADLEVVYGIDTAIYEFCQRSFSLPQYDHPLRPLITATTVYSRRTSPRIMMVIVSKDYMDLVCAEEGRVTIANRYTIKDPIDALYFITAVWRQQKLNDITDHLYVYSEIGATLKQLSEHLKPSIAHFYMNIYPGLLISPEQIKTIQGIIPPELILDRLCE